MASFEGRQKITIRMVGISLELVGLAWGDLLPAISPLLLPWPKFVKKTRGKQVSITRITASLER